MLFFSFYLVVIQVKDINWFEIFHFSKKRILLQKKRKNLQFGRFGRFANKRMWYKVFVDQIWESELFGYFQLIMFHVFYFFWKWMLFYYCPKLNGWVWVDFGCTHPIDGLFWNLPIYLLGFFSKYECWVTDLIMPLYHFILLGCHLPFCITRFHITMKHIKKFIWPIF